MQLLAIRVMLLQWPEAPWQCRTFWRSAKTPPCDNKRDFGSCGLLSAAKAPPLMLTRVLDTASQARVPPALTPVPSAAVRVTMTSPTQPAPGSAPAINHTSRALWRRAKPFPFLCRASPSPLDTHKASLPFPRWCLEVKTVMYSLAGNSSWSSEMPLDGPLFERR